MARLGVLVLVALLGAAAVDAQAPGSYGYASPPSPIAEVPASPPAQAPGSYGYASPPSPIAEVPASPPAQAPGTYGYASPPSPIAEVPASPPAQAPGSYGYASPPSPIAEVPASPPAPTPTPPAQTPPPPAPLLKVGFYKHSCPHAEDIVREAVRNATSVNPGLSAGLILMAFHDCFVQGCDASILLDPTTANPRPEKLGGPNFPSMRGFEVVDAAKATLEKACPGVVSCADVVQFAARDAAFFLSDSRVFYKLPAGRFDGRISFENESLAFLPPPSFNLSELITSFQVKGLDIDDLVVLSGSHSVGRSHCSSFSDRISTPPSDMDPSLATTLKGQCPANPNFTNDPTVVQDIVTPRDLDNQYYKNVLNHKVLFKSDASLLTSRVTARKVIENAVIGPRWEKKFAKAMVKMSLIEIKTAANGEIRKNCHVVN
ncbi:unnamed protein product [Urochloa decumbens]|uniref:peroxidase n=1 Tax=Urochloa decumbens TaxID=240449 RepID=A0ABC9G164_9POAL